MSRYKLDTNVAGAFMNIYQPIGDDPVVKCLEDDSDLSEYYAYRRKEIEEAQSLFISIGDMMRETDKYIVENFIIKVK